MDDTLFRTVHLKFSDDELAAIDDWQRRRKIRTRSEAIRQLIRHTLDADAAPETDAYRLAEKPSSGFTTPSLPPLRQNTPEDTLKQLIREEVAKAVALALKNKA